MLKKISEKSYLLQLIIGLLVIIALTSSFFTYQYLNLKSQSSEAFFLFVLKAKSGSLKKAPDQTWKLTVSDPGKIIYFSDRPQRIAGEKNVTDFINNWSKFGFDKNPPNAALSLDSKLNKGTDQDTIIVTLQNPIFDPKLNTVTFTVIQSANPSSGLESFKQKLDSSVPEEFIQPALFIDFSDQSNINNAESWNSFVYQA
jgi:hypothetical protein